MTIPKLQNDVEKGSEFEKSSNPSGNLATGLRREPIRSASRKASIIRSPSQRLHGDNTIGTTLTKVLTTRSNADVIDPGPPPDGGIQAWTQALMGHLVIFNTWGMISTFSVFQAYYTTELGLEPSAVSWIGSTQMLGHFSLGMFSGRALDAGYYHWVLIPGMLLVVLSMFMTSLCDEYWQLFLSQGIVFGLGAGLQFTPTSSLVFTYFSSHKIVALCILASGSATGGLVYPTIARQLIPKLGFAWTTRIMGFLELGVGCTYCSLLKPRLPPRKSGPLLEFAAFKEASYLLYCIGIFLVCSGQFFGFYYIGSYSLDVIGVSYDTSVNVLMIMNGIGVVGRILPGFVADRYLGGFNTIIPFVFASSVVMYCWAAVKSVEGLYAFSVFYGFVSAGFQGLFPAVLGTLTGDLSKVGARTGMGFSLVGIATLTGPPIAGALVQRDGYLSAQIWAGSMIFAGGLVLVLGRISKTGYHLRVKV